MVLLCLLYSVYLKVEAANDLQGAALFRRMPIRHLVVTNDITQSPLKHRNLQQPKL